MNDIIGVTPDLLVCFGAPRSDNRITDLEIINDQKMVSEIMEARRAIKECDRTLYQPKECRRFLKQTIEGGKISGIQSENIRFIKMKVENCCVEGIETKDIWSESNNVHLPAVCFMTRLRTVL